MKRIISTLLACATLTACATEYLGPHPDFTKEGSAAKAEYEKFEAGTGYGDFNLYSIEMGKKAYYRGSVEPILIEVSPTSVSKLERMRIAEYIGAGILVATIVAAYQPKSSWANQTGYWIGLGGIVGAGIYINVSGMNAAEDYNKDLKAKFKPGLALSKTF